MGEGIFNSSALALARLYRGGAADDSAAIATIFASGTYAVQLADRESFSFSTPLVLPNKTAITGGLGATLTSTVVNTGPSGCPFVAGTDAAVNSGTLHATPAIGAATVAVDTTLKPVVGHYLVVTHAVSAQVFEILAVSGSTSPYTVTIYSDGRGDRIGQPYVSGDAVEEYSARPADITIDGRGMSASGSGAQIVEIVHGLRCTVRGLTIRAADGTTGIGFDVGADQCRVEHCDISLAGSGSTVGGYLQSAVRSTIEHSTSRGAQFGFSMLDCLACGFLDLEVVGAARGIISGSLPLGSVASLGNRAGWLTGGSARSCGIGLDVFGSIGFTATSFAAVACTTYGILVESSSDVAHTITTTGTTLRSCSTLLCDVGVYVTGSAVGTTILDHDATGCVTAVLRAAGDVRVDGLRASALGATGAGVAEAMLLTGTNDIAHLTLDNTGASGSVAIRYDASGRLRDSTIAVNDLALYLVTPCTVRLDRVTVTAASRGVYVSAGCTVNIGPGCDMSAATTPISGPGTVVWEQTGGLVSVSATRALTFAEHYASAIELASGAAADTTITTYATPGLQFTVRNLTGAKVLTLQTTNAGTVVVAAGKSAIVEVNAAGVMARATADV